MPSNDFASGSDAANSGGEHGGSAKTDCGGTSGRGCEDGDECERGNTINSRMELAANGISQSEERREVRVERYGDAGHADDLLSPIVLGQQLVGGDLASGNVSATIEPVLGSGVLSSQQRGVNPVTKTKVESGSRSLPSQQLPTPTTKVEVNLSAPLPPESRLEGAFESSASLFEAIKDSSGAGNEPSGSPKRAVEKAEGGQPGSNGDHGGRGKQTKTLRKATPVKLELNRAAFAPLGCIVPKQRHENHLSGSSLKTSSQQRGSAERLENESAGPTSAEQRVHHISGRVKADAATVTKYLSKPSRTLSSQDSQSRGTPDHGPVINRPVTTTLHEYNAQNIADDMERYRMAGFPYPGPEYFSHAPPSGPSPTRPYQREAGVYCGEFNGREPRSRRSTQGQSQCSPPVVNSRPRRLTQGQSQRSQPAVGGIIPSSEGVSVPSSSLSLGNISSRASRPFHREAERYRGQLHGRQQRSNSSTQGQSQRSPPAASGFNGSRDASDALISSLSADNPTSAALRPFHRESAGHRRQSQGTQAVEHRRQPRVSQASRHRRQSQRNQSRFGHDTCPKPSTQEEAFLSSTQKQPHQQQPQAKPAFVTQTQLNIIPTCLIDGITRRDHTTNLSIGLSMPPATLPAINAPTATSAAPRADSMAPASVPLLSKSYFHQLCMMHKTGDQRPLANAPPSQTDNASSDPSILHLARSDQAQTLAAPARRAHFAQGSFITIHARVSQSQLAEAPSTQVRKASSVPSNPRQAHLADSGALAARIPSPVNLALPSARGTSTQPQHAHSTGPFNLHLSHPDQPQTTAARVSDAPQSAQGTSTQLQTEPHFPFSLLPGAIMPGTFAPYTWHHRGALPPLPNPANINDPTTQLSLYEHHIANVLYPKVTALMTVNTSVFLPILNANGTIRRMVLQELPALTPKYCDEIGKFTLRLTLTIRSLLQLHLSGYYAAIRTKMVRDLETNRILVFNKMQERICLENERLEEHMRRNGAVLSVLRRARPSSPPRSGDGVVVAPATAPALPSTLSQHSPSTPSKGVRLNTGARGAVTTANTSAQGTPTRLPALLSLR